LTQDNDLIKLYSNRILALAAGIPHLARLDSPDVSVRRRAPLCGSAVHIDVTLNDGRIAAFGQDIKACALGQAAAAVVGAQIIDCDHDTIERGRRQLAAMLEADGPVPDAPFDGLEVLRPAKDYKNRHASIMLVFDALHDAFEILQAKTASG